MAESVVFSLASKILSAVASRAFMKAYENGLSIWEARNELVKLRVTIETIQAVLLDAEKKQEISATVKNWIKRLKDVLFDAEDLFDEVATDDLLKQQMMEGNNKLSFKKKVWVTCSNLNPIVSRNSIAKKVKAIRKSLLEISSDMTGLGFVSSDKEEVISNGMRRGQDSGCFVDAKDVIGRKEDKKAILEMLFNELDNAKPDVPLVIVIVGIGGMGKTTLAQLIYNDDEVRRGFEKIWFACISDILDEKEVLGTIFQSIYGENYTSLTMSQLQTKIRESVMGKNFLLVLDDVWDEDRGRWLKRMSLLGGGTKGSRIIVTTRSSSVARALCAFKTHSLDGLSVNESWCLFKRVAFTPEQEIDPRWIDLGSEILKKCSNVPLAIRSIGSLLFEKNTIQEWESIRDEKLPRLGQSDEDGIMPVLKLSYDHLPSALKQCFAYCSLFPKDYRIFKQELIYLWIAQGYIKDNNEDVGHSHFMYLLRRGFFQEAVKDDYGEIKRCKMHDLIHDLAQHVAGEESIMLMASSNISNSTWHVSAGDFKLDESWAIPTSLLNVNRLRSFLLLNGGSICNLTLLDQLFANFKRLRALWLSGLGIENVPSSIGELKHLRYLDLSRNNFESLPDSVTNLLNLLTLDIRGCDQLEVLPKNLRKLINLRCLNIEKCDKVQYMPAGMGEMSCLQYLSHFKVGKAASEVEEGVKKRSGLDELARLQHQLIGELWIEFEDDIDEEEVWDGDECRWQLPVSPQLLSISRYPGRRIVDWGINIKGSANNLASLELRGCDKVKYLPPISCLPNLRHLTLYSLMELEYMEEEENEYIHNNANNSIFFLRLEELKLDDLPKLKGWWRKVASTFSRAPQFPLLSQLYLKDCPELELKSFPLCPHLQVLVLNRVDDNEVIQEQLSSTIFSCSSSISLSSPASIAPPAIEQITIWYCKWLGSFHDGGLASLLHLDIDQCFSLKSLHLASPHLQKISIWGCPELMSFELLIEAPTSSLQDLKIGCCKQLKNLHIGAHLNSLEELWIIKCPELELWASLDERRCHLDWDSFTNLRQLKLDPLPPQEKLPHCFQQRHALGKLTITDWYGESMAFDSDSKCLDSEDSSELEDLITAQCTVC